MHGRPERDGVIHVTGSMTPLTRVSTADLVTDDLADGSGTQDARDDLG